MHISFSVPCLNKWGHSLSHLFRPKSLESTLIPLFGLIFKICIESNYFHLVQAIVIFHPILQNLYALSSGYATFCRTLLLSKF
jgi:hypothetical protein